MVQVNLAVRIALESFKRFAYAHPIFNLPHHLICLNVSGNDPSITINVGDEINFIVDAASHPFYIKTVQGTGTDNLASNVTNNGATSGVVNWTPTTAGTYYYQCSVHNGMYGTITVQ